MTRRRKIVVVAAASLAGLLTVVVVAGILIVQTTWFRGVVRQKIVTAVEESTGGKAEIASFSFDWRHLRARISGFVIHGLEPPTVPPLLRANLVEIDLKLLSPFRGFVDIAYLLVDTPQANIIVYRDGHTNIPSPKVSSTSNKSGAQTIVDLAIGRFDLRNGTATFANLKSKLNASGANFRAQLAYSALPGRYTGEISVAPLYVQRDSNPPLDVNVSLPLTIEKDRITLTNARLSTPGSQILLSGSVDHLIDPRTSARVNASVALAEIKRTLGLSVPLDTTHAPGLVMAEVSGSMDANGAQIESAHVTLGHSGIEAAGTLNKQGHSSAHFRASLALGEIGRLLRVSEHPEGTATIDGTAALSAGSASKVNASLSARNLAIRQGATRLSGVSLDMGIAADAHRIQLSGIRLAALGGSLTGSGSVAELAQFQVAGNLHGFDTLAVARALAPGAPSYDGVISGPVELAGNLHDVSGLIARANLAIAPGPHGVPVSGHLGLDYNARNDTLKVDHSHLTFPHSKVELSGSLAQRIQVRLVSRNFSDFTPIAVLPVTFTGRGSASVNATLTGSLSAPRINAQLSATDLAVSGRAFTHLTATLDASPSRATVNNAVLSRGSLHAQFSGDIGLRNWKPEPFEPLAANLTVRNAGVSDILALAGQPGFHATGNFAADARISGTVGSPTGTAEINVDHGSLEGEPFDTFTARAIMDRTSVDVPQFAFVAGPSRIDANASYQHAVDNLERGALTARVSSSQLQLARFQSLVKDRPGLEGLLSLNANMAGTVAPSPSGTEFQLASLNANVAARQLAMEGKTLGDLTATASTADSAVRYNVDSNFAGSTIRISGQSLLAGGHQTSATASIANLPIDRLLAVAGKRQLPVLGTLSANAQLNGALQNLQGSGSMTLTDGSVYHQPFKTLQVSATYTPVLINVSQFRIDDGPSNLELIANFNHPAGDFGDGRLQLHVRSNEIQLSRIPTIAEAHPGFAGTVQLTADSVAMLHRNAPLDLSALNARFSAQDLSVNNKPLGNVTATASTSGNRVSFTLASNLARSNIRGSGRLGLTAGYPLEASLTFSGLTYSALSPLISSAPEPFDGSLDGQLNISGPVEHVDALRGNLELTKLEAHSIPSGTSATAPRIAFEVHNSGNIDLALANSIVTMRNFRLAGTDVNLTASGTASINTPSGARPVNIRAGGNVNLEVLQAFSPDVVSSGTVTLNAAVTGNITKPVVNGRLQLRNASFHMMSLPNGLSKANGAVDFNGTEAVIDNLTGEVGGGKVTLAGFYSYGGTEPHFRIQANASHVHVNYPETITSEANASLTLMGAESRSLLSGTVTVLNVAMHSHTDIGSVLTSAAAPPSAGAPTTGPLTGMRFDVRIQTSPAIQFRSDLAQNLQADGTMTLRGTPDNPGMIGRLSVTSGDLIFFGNTYTVDQGTITFSNPNQIAPILNVDLGTTVQGVDVTLNISGSMEKLKLTYHSDPPLEFQQLVSLLAAGRTPTTDPVIASEQPPAPQQNLEQSGASAVLSQAVNPFTNRLQHLFGVTRLSVDPQIVGQTTNNPQATLTLQQQITPNIVFTYIQDVTQSTPMAISVQWSLSPTYSLVAQRDIFGEFSVDIFYKKRFH